MRLVYTYRSLRRSVTDLHNQIDAIVQRIGGAIERTDNWGRRRLAYEIGRHKEGPTCWK
jgi:ribosomal protein S6